MNDKKVSIVIPFYNRRREVMDAIKSVLAQSFTNFEIILINDGSDDNLSEIRELVKHNNKVKLLNNKKNVGASASRNLGIKNASGDYIAFLDSDDVFLPKKLATQVQYMVASNAIFSHTSYQRRWKGQDEIIHSGLDNGHCERKMIYNCPIATPTVMIDVKWLRDNNVLFNEDAEIGEDTCFWLDIIKNEGYLVGIDEALTIVNVGDTAAAYTDEKQIIGLKTIIRYLLNSEYYSKYDYEISLLMKAYTSYVEKTNEEDDPLLVGSSLHKLLFYMKTEGVRSATKRVAKKISSVVKKK